MRNTSLTNLSSARHAAFLVVMLAACAPYPQRVHEEPIMVNGDRVPAVDASYAAADVANERYAIKATVDSIVWAQGQGQVSNSTQLPMTGYGPMPPGRFPVRLSVASRDTDLFLPAGAVGDGAIYTDYGSAIHIIRKVILRVGAKLDYLVLKLH